MPAFSPMTQPAPEKPCIRYALHLRDSIQGMELRFQGMRDYESSCPQLLIPTTRMPQTLNITVNVMSITSQVYYADQGLPLIWITLILLQK